MMKKESKDLSSPSPTTGSTSTLVDGYAPANSNANAKANDATYSYMYSSDDDDDSLATFETGLALLQKYNGTTSTRGVVAHKRNSVVSAQNSVKNDADGHILTKEKKKSTAAAAAAEPSPMSQPSSQRRVIFPSLYGQNVREKIEEKEKKTLTKATKPSRREEKRPHFRSLSPVQKNGGHNTGSIPVDSTRAFVAALKSPLAATKGFQSKTDCILSDDELIDAMEDQYVPTSNKRLQQTNKTSHRIRSNSTGGIPVLSAPGRLASPAVKTARSTTTYPRVALRSGSNPNSTQRSLFISPYQRIHEPIAILDREAASGEIVLHPSSKDTSSPHRKISLFHTGTHRPRNQLPESSQLQARSPPSRDTAVQPLPSILRKSLIQSPLKSGASRDSSRRNSLGGFGKDASRSANKRTNTDAPGIVQPSSLEVTSSELEQNVSRFSSRDESTAASVSFSHRSETSSTLRRVASETSIASSQETERKRATAMTVSATAAVLGAEAAEAAVASTNNVDNPPPQKYKQKSMTRHASLENCEVKEITFDPRVWVVEYEQDDCNNWFTHAELEQFKCEAIDRIRRRHAQQQLTSSFITSGTGRILVPLQRPGSGRALFTDPALGCGTEEAECCDDDDDAIPGATTKVPQSIASIHVPQNLSSSSSSDAKRIQRSMLSEIRNILLVDPHDMFLKLFSKALRAMMNHVIITTATSAEEAQRRIAAAKVVFPQSEGGATQGFDIIIVEERLQLFHRQTRGSRSDGKGSLQQTPGDDQNQRSTSTSTSGSELIRTISAQQKSIVSTVKSRPRYSLLIGVSAHVQLDGERLRQSGADFVWGKPPPPFNDELKREILRAILNKRGKNVLF